MCFFIYFYFIYAYEPKNVRLLNDKERKYEKKLIGIKINFSAFRRKGALLQAF